MLSDQQTNAAIAVLVLSVCFPVKPQLIWVSRHMGFLALLLLLASFSTHAEEWKGKTRLAFTIPSLSRPGKHDMIVTLSPIRSSLTDLQGLVAREELGFQSAALGLVCDAACCQHQGRASGQARLLANELHTWYQHVHGVCSLLCHNMAHQITACRA